MIGWFKRKSKLEILKEHYRRLMRKSFEASLTDPKEGDRAHRKADKIYEEIKYLSMNNGD